MCESRAVPSGDVYQQMFDAQVQLSRSLRAGRRDTRTGCLSADDSNTTCSTTNRGQLFDTDADDDEKDVIRLPDTVAVAERPNSDVIERLCKKRQENHNGALRQLNETLKELTEDCERGLRTDAQQLLSSLRDADDEVAVQKLRLAETELLHEELCVIWQQLEEQLKVKKMRITDFGTKLKERERGRKTEIQAALRSCCHLMENISFMKMADIHQLLHTEATMLNQSLLANRRSSARLLFRLREETLEQESLLRRHWEDRLDLWRKTRVQQVIQQFRNKEVQDQDQDQHLLSAQRALTERRRDIIYQISSLVPPTCSISMVSDWFDQITAVNQQIDSCHADLLHWWRCSSDRVLQERLAEVEHCKEALSALELQEGEVRDVVDSQLLPLIDQQQREEEERLATVDVCNDHAASHALCLSRAVLLVMRAVALLWETHGRNLAKKEEEEQRHLEDVKRSLQQDIQKKKAHMDGLLRALRQESSNEAAKESLSKAVLHLQEVQNSCSRCVTAQWNVLDRLPSVLHDELLSYSRSLSSFFNLSPAYQLSPEEMAKLHPSLQSPTHPDQDAAVEPGDDEPATSQDESDSAHSTQDWLTEAQSSLSQFYDIDRDDSVTSSGGVVYSGPTFSFPALPDELQKDSHLSVFPVELLTHTLSRARTRFLDHLEQHFVDILSDAVAMVTLKKETVRSEQELQLQHLDPEHIQNHIYQPRLAELQLHQQQVALHCQEMLDIKASCRTRLEELRTSLSRTHQDLLASLSSIENQVQDQGQTAHSSQRLQAVSAALQDCLDKQTRDTQHHLTAFKSSLSESLEEVRTRTAQLLTSFRLFSEGGVFSAREVKTFQRRLKDNGKQLDEEEESILAELNILESRSLQQVKEASTRLEEKVSVLKSKATFSDKIQKLMSNTQVRIQAEKLRSNQQQAAIRIKIQDLKRMLESSKVFPDQVWELLSSLSDDLRRRCQYLDLQWDSALQDSVALEASSESQVQVPEGPPVVLQAIQRGVDLLEDPIVDLIQSLSRFGCAPEMSDDRGSEPGQRPSQPPRSSKSIGALRKAPVSGDWVDEDQGLRSFIVVLDAVLWNTNSAVLQAAEEFYRLNRFQLLSEHLDQWAESLKQRLLGNQEEASKFLNTSREEVLKQLAVLDQMLYSIPEVLIRKREDRQGAELKEELDGVRQKLMETLSASEKEKDLNVDRLRASLRGDALKELDSRETLRQQQLYDATSRAHHELQECARVRGEEFVTSLVSLTEKFLPFLEVFSVTMETRTNHDDAESSEVTTATNTARLAQRRQSVGVERDAAVERFNQLILSESLQSDGEKRQQLSQQQAWNAHWRQQIHTLSRTLH